MKKLMLSAVLAVFAFSGLKAQSTGFEAGAYLGLPMGDIKDGTSINLGITAAYYWTVAENFEAGILAGYDHWTAKKVNGYKGDDLGFIPIAASAKYGFGSNIFGGLDLGYGIGASKGNDGGFYYRPRVGYTNTSFDIYLFYKGISSKVKSQDTILIDDKSSNSSTFTASSLGVGFSYKF